MVTYRNRDPEPSVRFRPPHPVFKVLAVLFCCVQLLAVPAFAVDDAEWVSLDFDEYNMQYMESGGNSFQIYGSQTNYSLDDNGNAHFETVRPDNPSYSITYGNYDVTKRSDRWRVDIPSNVTTGAPYDHYVSDQSTYYRFYEYTQYGFRGAQALFVTDLLLPAGYYQLQSSFDLSQFVIFGNLGSQYFRPTLFCIALVNESKEDLQVYCFPDTADVTFNITEDSYLAFGCTYSSVLQPYIQQGNGSNPWPNLRFDLKVNSLRYRTIDPMDLAALDEANTNAGNTITDYDNVEQQWTGSMSENFSQLNLGGFSFGDGLISGFGLVSDLFMKVWIALGSYAIVFTFPLYLGIVLVLMGRVNRFIGHLDRKGDSDA